MQKWILNIPVLLVFLFSSLSLAMANGNRTFLQQADSLYRKKKYTEACEIYFKLYQQGYSSPATLLKMAFVKEGLGQTGQALFFLSAYYTQTEDPKAYDKIHSLAGAGGLKGYELPDFDRITIWLGNRVLILSLVLASVSLFCLALMIYCKKNGYANGKMAVGFVSLVFILLLFVSINVIASPPARAVIVEPTYFMSGPSPASNFIERVGEGNQVVLSGEHDVWVGVEWNGKQGYLKKDDLFMYK